MSVRVSAFVLLPCPLWPDRWFALRDALEAMEGVFALDDPDPDLFAGVTGLDVQCWTRWPDSTRWPVRSVRFLAELDATVRRVVPMSHLIVGSDLMGGVTSAATVASVVDDACDGDPEETFAHFWMGDATLWTSRIAVFAMARATEIEQGNQS